MLYNFLRKLPVLKLGTLFNTANCKRNHYIYTRCRTLQISTYALRVTMRSTGTGTVFNGGLRSALAEIDRHGQPTVTLLSQEVLVKVPKV
jgi:hypothetical protein